MNDPEVLALLAELQEQLEHAKIRTIEGQFSSDDVDSLGASLTRLIYDMDRITPLTGPAGHKPTPTITLPKDPKKLKFK